MKCRNCPKPATLHITEIVKGAAQELHLCESCAQQYLSTESQAETEPAAEEEAVAQETDEELDRLDKLVCPTCGQSFREFRNIGRLGCPHCYIAFEAELLPLLENIQGETHHAGKCPKRAPHDSQKQYELIKLRGDLRQAVDDERYEDAAKLRDQIQGLEADLKTGVG